MARRISSIQYSSDEQIKKKGDQIRGATRAIFQAIRFMKSRTHEAAALIGAKLNWTPDVVTAVHRAWTPYFPEDGRIRVENLKAMQDALIEAGSVRKRLPLEDHYTTDFTPVGS